MTAERWWPKWWWRYPLSTGIFSPRLPEKYAEPKDDGEGFIASYAPMEPEPREITAVRNVELIWTDHPLPGQEIVAEPEHG